MDQLFGLQHRRTDPVITRRFSMSEKQLIYYFFNLLRPFCH